MAWELSTSYRGIIGGCYFANVPTIVEYSGGPVITIKRESESGDFGVDVGLIASNGQAIAEVRNGNISLLDQNDFQVRTLGTRAAIVNISDGRVIFDLETRSKKPNCNIELSLTTFLPNGVPVFLHPNRIKIGSSHILRPHVSFLKLETMPGAIGPAIRTKLKAAHNSESLAYEPRVPIIGASSEVRTFVSWGEEDDQLHASSLFLYDDRNQAGCLSFEGPIYFLDLAFLNFRTAISIEPLANDKPKKNQV